jgi:hypothetical protein
MNRRTTRLWRRMRVIILMSAAFLLGMGTLFATPAFADWATPFVEINNKLGDVSESHAYVVALGADVETCDHYLVVVTTDCMEHIVIRATAEPGVVKESLLGRPVLVRGKVVERKEDSETGRVSVELQILEMKPIPSPESEETSNVE